MRKMLSLIVVAAMLSFSAGAYAAEYFTKTKDDKRRLEPTGEMAVVYVFRPAMLGAAIKTWSFYDDELIGVSKAKAYHAALVPAGKRIIWSKAENTSALEIDVKAGETYYFKQAIKMGFNKARVKMVAIDEAEATKYFGKCSYAQPTEVGRERAAEIAANRLERAQNKVEEQAAKTKGKGKKKKKGK